MQKFEIGSKYYPFFKNLLLPDDLSVVFCIQTSDHASRYLVNGPFVVFELLMSYGLLQSSLDLLYQNIVCDFCYFGLLGMYSNLLINNIRM